MAWSRQATSHYLSQCWPSPMSSYGFTRPQWVKPKTSEFQRHLSSSTVAASTLTIPSLPTVAASTLTIPSLPTVAASTLTIPSLTTVAASTLTIPSLPGITSWPQPHLYATDPNTIKLQAIWTAKLSQYTIVPGGQHINVESGWMAASIYSTIKQKLASNPNAMLHNRCITAFHSHMI